MRVTFVPEGEEKVVRQCRIHPNLRAVVDMHNLRRDEHLEMCVACFAWWIGRYSFENGIYNEMAQAYELLEPFASEIAAQATAREREGTAPRSSMGGFEAPA